MGNSRMYLEAPGPLSARARETGALVTASVPGLGTGLWRPVRCLFGAGVWGGGWSSKPNAFSLAWKGLILGPGARLRADAMGRVAREAYVCGESSRICPLVEKVPYSPAHWLTRTGTSTLEVGHPDIGVALMRAKVSKIVSFRDSLLQARACFREVLKCSVESHG